MRRPRPVIGVTGPRGRHRLLWWFTALSLALHGARPRRITPPADPEAFSGLDGLVIGGGDDITPVLYGGEPAPGVRLDPDRDALELEALRQVWDSEIPVMGICRGAQMLNVFRGGRLHQDIYETYADAPRLRTPLPRKQVTLADGSRLAAIIDRSCIVVNALHHQSIDEAGEQMAVVGHDDYGIVQAVEHEGERFRVGVQWHPEFLFYRRAHRRLFGALVEAARGARATPR